jgi:phage repressor protein C with HTH and peptisase S24 domain
MKTDERKKIKSDAKSKASEVLAQKDEAAMLAKTEELFNDVLIELAEAKAEKDKSVEDNTKLAEDLENLKSEKDELATQKADFEAKAVELQQKLEEADKKIKELEGQLESVKQEAALQARVAELEEAGLLSAGKAADKQKSRIKAMDDEAFAEYKSELLELKETWVKKEEEAKSNDKPKEEKKEDPKGKKAAPKKEEEEEADEDEDLTAAAALAELAELENIDDETKISAAQLLKIKKAAAALNVASLSMQAEIDDDEAPIGVDPGLLKEYDDMWSEDGGK